MNRPLHVDGSARRMAWKRWKALCSRFAAAQRGQFNSIEINPVLVAPAVGCGAGRVYSDANSVTGGHLTMNRFYCRPTLTVGAALLAAACANSGAAETEKEDLLVGAGFVPKKANSAARMATLKSLPPHQFVTRTINGGTRYLYADPTICGCIYVGDQKAYDQYRQKMAAVQTATDEQIRSVLSATPLPGESGL